jgi:hypothetical protein
MRRVLDNVVQIVATVCIMLHLFCLFANCEELGGRIAGANLLATPAKSIKTETQLFRGTNTKGPFVLAWKQIEELSEQVVVDGNLLQRGVHYNVDYVNGILAFNYPVPTGSVIRIEYSYDPSRATKNPSSLTFPLSLDILKNQKSDIQLVGLYKQADPSDKTSSDLTVYGLSGATKDNKRELSLLLLLSPDKTDSLSSENIPFEDQSALRLGGTISTSSLKITTSLIHVGEQFRGAQEYRLQQGLDSLDLNASLAISPKLSLSSVVKRTEYSYGEKKGQMDATEAYSLVYSGEKGPKVTIAHTESEKAKPGTVNLATTSDKVLVEQKIGNNISATASHERTTTLTGDLQTSMATSTATVKYGTADTTITSSLTQKETTGEGQQSKLTVGVDKKLTPTLSISAALDRSASEKTGRVDTETLRLIGSPNTRFDYEMALVHKDSNSTGEEYSGSLKINMAPASWLSAKAMVGHTESESYGRLGTQSLNLTARPNDSTNIEVSIAHKDLAGIDELSHNIKLVSALHQNLRLEFATVAKNIEEGEDETLRTAAVVATAAKNTLVQLAWAEKEFDTKDSEHSTTVKVETTPSPTVKLSGAIAQKEVGPVQEISTEARVDLSPLSHTKISGGVKESRSDSSLAYRTTEISTSTKPLSGLEVSGTYKARDIPGNEDIDSLNLTLSLSTLRSLALTAAYVSNPEGKQGTIQRFNSQTIGLKSDFGRLKLRSAFSYKDEYLVGKRSGTLELGLDYRLSANAFLTTSYYLSEYREGSALETEVYTLGYTHRVGSRLNLYLGGKITTQTGDIGVEDNKNYEAEAKLGIKF